MSHDVIILTNMWACDSMGLKINVGKTKVLTIEKDQMGSCEKVGVNGEEMQKVGIMISTDGSMGEKVAHRVVEGRKVWGRWQNYGRI